MKYTMSGWELSQSEIGCMHKYLDPQEVWSKNFVYFIINSSYMYLPQVHDIVQMQYVSMHVY